VYETKAAEERLRVSRDMKRLVDAGLWPESSGGNSGTNADGETNNDDDAILFPVARIRKICKLDPDVKGISKESALLITKATELFCAKLGKECVIMAQMQNRRKLLPEDVVEVCSMKEAFMFLRSDLIDLRKAQIEETHLKEKEIGKEHGGSGGDAAAEEGGTAKSNTLDSYFGKVRN
jgi:DNA-directed RNA polymerase I subunit RPA43